MPELGRGLGEAIRGFKDSINPDKKQEPAAKSDKTE
ncbi:MAG TPA: twin-arginine translocase TatA/TatE family subunit [Thermoanaerobaculia bacterium]